jgi:hypothetical protein
MSDQSRAMKELNNDVEFIELPALVVKEHLLRLFNNQVQRDYVVGDFFAMDGNIVVKLKRRVPTK